MAKKKTKKVTRSAEALEYFKYNPETDGDQTFNIDLALNQNWDKTKAEFVRQEVEIEAVKEQVENVDVSWDGITGKWRDARGEGNKGPKWYNARGITIELVNATDVAHTGGLATLITYSAWNDYTGGCHQELILGQYDIVHRSAINDDTWTVWNKADARNADTVGGLQAWQLGTLTAAGTPHYTSFPLYCQFNKNGDSRFRLFIEGHTTSVDHSYNTDKVKNRDLASEVDSLKQSVVNGKQTVVNAINDKIGKDSGLTTNHTFDDYAWFIRNIIQDVNVNLAVERYLIAGSTGFISWSNGMNKLPYTRNVSLEAPANANRVLNVSESYFVITYEDYRNAYRVTNATEVYDTSHVNNSKTRICIYRNNGGASITYGLGDACYDKFYGVTQPTINYILGL